MNVSPILNISNLILNLWEPRSFVWYFKNWFGFQFPLVPKMERPANTGDWWD